MPHCLKEGALFLISIPRALSPERNKALAPHWTEHMAALQHSRGTDAVVAEGLGQGAVTKGGKGSKKERSSLYPAEKTLTSLLYNQERQWQPRTAFSKTKPPELFALPRLRTATSLLWWP